MARQNQLAIATAATLCIAVALWLALRSGSHQGDARAALPAAPSLTPPAARADTAPAFAGPRLRNRAAYIPAQCYATTRGEGGRTRNGCYVCHQDSREPNYVNDADVQSELSFAQYATQNRWANLKAPPAPSTLTDDELLAWVRGSNYFDRDGSLKLAKRLASPGEWDTNRDGAWNGFRPDCFFQFDALGFDRDPGGKPTGWRAYAATPLPGMFMPTNGSVGDVMIRLPPAFRQDAEGAESELIYRLNLAIVEAFVARRSVPIPATDEAPLGSDLDGNGVLGLARRVAFVWPPKPGRPFHYVGQAAKLDAASEGWPVAGLFPRGTELLHSVRYFDVVGGQVQMAARMKELRYMRKMRFMSYGQLDQAAQSEAREKQKSPDKLKQVFADAEHGVTTGVGWLMQGFIEDAAGELRPQNVEETTACIGCHGGVGVTTDATFSFARKLPASSSQDGWYYPSLTDLRGLADPKRADGRGEYATFLAQVGAGDDFDTNDEARRRFFKSDGRLDTRQSDRLAKDISLLLVPSPERALALDRAYLGLVQAQRFEAGRDATHGGPARLLEQVEQGEATGIDEPLLPGWKRPERLASR